jgi:hypothetical protein
MELMSEKQWKRCDVLERFGAGKLTAHEAARVLGLSERQLRRLRRAFEKVGRGALVHGSTGRVPVNRTEDDVRAHIVELARTKYAGFNDQHLTEKLLDDEGFILSRATVQRLLRSAGIAAARRRRPPKHRRRRDRKPQAGLMILWDGSRHEWLEGRGPMLCLIGAIDDATSEFLPGAHFVGQECSAGYLTVLREICREKGMPHSAYGDQHGTLKRNDTFWTLEEEMQGEQQPTQVGRALRELGVEQIHALSPQAKGRVERLWGTLQDRLTSELRLAGASTAAEANEVLARFRPTFNQRFAVAPVDTTPAWRSVRRLDLDRICAFRYDRQVGNDNAVRIAREVIDIPPGPHRRSYARALVEVRQLLDGSWRVYLGDALIAAKSAAVVGELRTLKEDKDSLASRANRQRVANFGTRELRAVQTGRTESLSS